MARGSSPTEIKDDSFKGKDIITPTHQKSLIVESFTNAAEKLIPDWNKQLVVMVGLTANNTNSKVANAQLSLHGTLNLDKKSFKASNYWDFEDPLLKFSLANIDARAFRFTSGCTSDFIDGADCDYSFKSGDSSLSDDQLEELNFLGFSLRAHVAPINPAGWANLAVSLYPATRDKLLEKYPETAKAGNFPGFGIFAGVVPMGPRTEAVFPDLEYGSPVLPAITPGVSALHEFALNLESSDILSAMASLFRKAVKLDNKKNFRTLAARWAEIDAKKAGGLLPAAPDALWPSTNSVAVVNLGRESVLLFPPPPPLTWVLLQPLFPEAGLINSGDFFGTKGGIFTQPEKKKRPSKIAVFSFNYYPPPHPALPCQRNVSTFFMGLISF